MQHQELIALHSRDARQAAQRGDWPTVARLAATLMQLDPRHPEGHFLQGLHAKAQRRPQVALESFTQALRLDQQRYDAAVELASLLPLIGQYGKALELLEHYRPYLERSPRYLEAASSTLLRLGLPDRAWPLICKAYELQPEIERFAANKAECAVYVGELETAEALYRELLERFPLHQRYHYQYSRLKRATDDTHVRAMQEVLAQRELPDARNIFLYYALGKELEDLGRWREAFAYYERAGKAAAAAADYRVEQDLELIDALIKGCTKQWLARSTAAAGEGAQPIFVTGLPRTGTTLVERILSNHRTVESAGESFFLQLALMQASGRQGLNAELISAALDVKPEAIAQRYRHTIAYRLHGKPWFIDKLPENFFFLGHIARAFPEGKIVHLRRHPLDACFALFKQSYFRYAYRLDDLARFYVAYHRLMEHWRALLGERLIEVEYESLVSDPTATITKLLDTLGLAVEPACFDFHNNVTATNTASAIQVREPMHQRSVGKWRHFARELEPLSQALRDASIPL